MQHEREVVIVDCIYDIPNKTSLGNATVKTTIKDNKDILKGRLKEMEKLQETEITFNDSFHGVFYESIDERFPLESISLDKKRYLISSEKITLSLLNSLLKRNHIDQKKGFLLTLGSANTDSLSKYQLIERNGETLAQNFELADPLGYLKLLDYQGTFAVESISEASTSGIASLYNAYIKIKEGAFDTAIVGGASAVTFPVPFEFSQFGVGDERFIEPFEEDAKGRYFSEGGAAFLLKEKQQAEKDGDQILAEIKDISSGTMGNVVVNRRAVKKMLERSFSKAAVASNDNIVVELYGRGNEVDDAAEFSLVKNLKKTYSNLKGGFFKEDIHYVVGYYSLLGLCRMLDAEDEKSGRLIKEPNRLIGQVDETLWTDQFDEAALISILAYSMYGNMFNLLIKRVNTMNEGSEVS
ncbi:beta-ketoacyl synthase N-terminal-like domain-containing protein [Enterococcus sp. LJL98]